jgi:hypothetical protein
VKHWLALLLLGLLSACQSAAPFPPLNLSAPGWHTGTGQAIWKPDRSKPEIVGDLLVASDERGNAYLQFSKAFPIVTARLSRESRERWEVEFPPQNKHYSAPGKPPAGIVWLQLLSAMSGGDVNRHWELQRSSDSLSMTNRRSGESLEVHFE